jgi:hypothetical protein
MPKRPLPSEPTPPPPEIVLILHLLDEAFEKKAWHGPNLRGALRGVTAEQAAWRPAPERHNVWEYVLHAAYWKYAVTRKLTGEKRGSFPLSGSNWFPRPDGELPLSEVDWKRDQQILVEQHRRLRKVAASFPAERLFERIPGTAHSAARLLAGVAAHDLYHAGQIQFVKRMRKG